jgi:transposase InsO family protein
VVLNQGNQVGPNWGNSAGLHSMTQKPVLHGDNGSTLKATTVLAMMYWLGLKASYSRPRVSDDNAFVESLFRTAKYRPEFPAKGFADLTEARRWASLFVSWLRIPLKVNADSGARSHRSRVQSNPSSPLTSAPHRLW